ncbi:MAG: A/G-specific adenine glycosylase [Bacteroidales bacterium]
MEISSTLINWYVRNKRNLPWRATSDPYTIWVSEIILQQTRVDQGLKYFERFMASFPDVYTLASATELEVLKCWQGLGYYTRARNMHSTAKTIAEEMKGLFPIKSAELLKLKGIGPYTASAIASICFGEPCPVVDGNVMRVVARYFGINLAVNTPEGQKAIYEASNLIIDRTRPGEFNQAIMEFGALQCTPLKPKCILCPLKPDCQAYRERKVGSLPVKVKPAKPRDRHFYYLAVVHEDKDGDQVIYINKRTGSDIWKGLYEFPLVELAVASEPQGLYSSPGWNAIFGHQPLEIIEYSNVYKHFLSHQTIHARFIRIKVKQLPEGSRTWQKVKFSKLSEFPIPRLIDRYLKNKKIL